MSFNKVLCLLFILIISGTSIMAATEQKIAVVDVNKIVSVSPQAIALDKLQKTKAEEIAKFVKTAQENINKQKDEKAKKQLITKYEKELNAKNEANAKEYNLKIKELDKNITAIITQKAKSMGYTMVIAKYAVMTTGDDITNEVIKVIK